MFCVVLNTRVTLGMSFFLFCHQRIVGQQLLVLFGRVERVCQIGWIWLLRITELVGRIG